MKQGESASGGGIQGDAPDIVSVSRDGKQTSLTRLQAAGAGLVLVRNSSTTVVVGPVEAAVRRLRSLSVIDPAVPTRIVCKGPGAPTADAYLALLRFTPGGASADGDVELDDDDYLEDEDDWYDATRTDINGRRVAIVHCEGASAAAAAVWRDQLDEPTGPWAAVLANDWDSSSYAGVGNAGTGSLGVYEIRPGLYATLQVEDGHVEEARFFRTSAPPRQVALDFVEKELGTENFLAHFGGISPLTKGVSFGELPEDTEVSTSLTRRDLQWMVRKVATPALLAGRQPRHWVSPEGRRFPLVRLRTVAPPSYSPAAVHARDLAKRWLSQSYDIAVYASDDGAPSEGSVLIPFGGSDGGRLGTHTPPAQAPAALAYQGRDTLKGVVSAEVEAADPSS